MPLTKIDPVFKQKRRIQELENHMKHGDVKKMADSINRTRGAIHYRMQNPEHLDVDFLEKLFEVTDWSDEEIIRFVRGNY